MVAFSLNECYFANKGAAVVLGASERGCGEQRRSPVRAHPPSDIQHHLQSMFYLLRPEETLKMAVKLESAHPGRTRYLVVVCRSEEAALLGIDCNERTSVGLVLRVLADTSIKLDGDGGFSVCVCSQQHIFKPVSVQAMWSALQTLHRASGRARELNHFAGGTSHAWCAYYESHVDSDRSCLNEWHAMDSIESRRPPSPDSLRHKPRQRDETERVIRCTLKEIMMSVDLDEVTSKAIRGRLEAELDMDLAEYKSFIDQEMLTILGQMDAPTEIFDHVYLGSEWNASNLEELQRNGVRHILNVTREIDNFFPGMFDYLNIRVYDDEKTDLLKHWDNTFKYINKARNEGSKVLVHCKMGISRSASVVIAYAMKAFNWNFDKALKHVKWKRSCIKPNNNFLNQLETYQGILDAMKNKEKLQRSKSETNLKAKTAGKAESKVSSPTPLVLAAGGGGGACGGGSRRARPRSWSPDSRRAAPAPPAPPTSVSLEHLPLEQACGEQARHMLMPCANGTYSVSPNQIIRLKEEEEPSDAPSVRHIVSEIENAACTDRRESSRRYQRLISCLRADPPAPTDPAAPSLSKSVCHKTPQSNFEPEKIHTWDPGEAPVRESRSCSETDTIVKSDSGTIDVINRVTVTDNVVERHFGEERRESSRQSSWSSSDSGSRHSSWAPRPDDPLNLASITEHRETQARSAHIADNERKFNETCAILKELAGAAARMESARRRGASTWSGRLSASAPPDTWLRAAPRRRRLAAGSHGDLPRAAAAPAPPLAPASLVTHLKREFEARAEPCADDVSVRVLVHRYERPRTRARCDSAGERRVDRSRTQPPSAPAPAPAFAPRDRPPLAPTVVSIAPFDYNSDVLVSTVMSKAQNKKQLQHGKTHPLTRLNLNRSNNRCSNPVYNTM